MQFIYGPSVQENIELKARNRAIEEELEAMREQMRAMRLSQGQVE